ncbi:unnamed protein product [Allacma fusca]|uniref:Uncharacterized protein n=1 Tax=Allacma fusca TaxID=39272 RepID=A0A8J2PIR8_9HEXA|nr:unnamed protein product [Allacma fusca]
MTIKFQIHTPAWIIYHTGTFTPPENTTLSNTSVTGLYDIEKQQAKGLQLSNDSNDARKFMGSYNHIAFRRPEPANWKRFSSKRLLILLTMDHNYLRISQPNPFLLLKKLPPDM